MSESDPARTGSVAATCPACSPSVPTGHEVLADGGQKTVRCTDCGHVHTVRIDDRTVEPSVVVSQDGDSFTTSVEIPVGERLAVGDEFVVEAAEGVFVVRVTSLELGPERRADRAPAEDVATVWTRDVGNVSVDVTVHPPGGDGGRERTRSVTVHLPGDYEFVVGETTTLAEETVAVEGLYLRDRAVGYEFEKLDHEGDAAPAKDLKRVYARGTGGHGGPRGPAWAGW